MLKRAEARFEKAAASQNTSILSRPPGRPSLASQTSSSIPVAFHGLTEQTSKRILRSSTATFNKKLCFFCQSHDDKQDIHLIHTENWRKQLSEFVKNCHNDLYKVYLTSKIELDDALPIDVHYHRTCWMKHVIRDMAPQDNDRADAQDSEQGNKVVANIEFLHLIQELLKKKKKDTETGRRSKGVHEYLTRSSVQLVVPTKLFTSLKWILSGVVSELKT